MTTRRNFLLSAVTVGSMAGCLGEQRNRPGVVDSKDVTAKSNGSAKFSVTNVSDDDNSGLKLSTEDSVADDVVKSGFPVNVPTPMETNVYAGADVERLDDDAEIEIQFRTDGTPHRTIYIGNEYKNMENGVLATETGTGYSLRSPFKELPSPDGKKNGKISELDTIQFVIRDGDFTGTIWSLGFIYENRTIGFL